MINGSIKDYYYYYHYQEVILSVTKKIDHLACHGVARGGGDEEDFAPSSQMEAGWAEAIQKLEEDGNCQTIRIRFLCHHLPSLTSYQEM